MIPKAVAKKAAAVVVNGVKVTAVVQNAAAKRTKKGKADKKKEMPTAALKPTYRTRSGRTVQKRVMHNIADPPTPEAAEATATDMVVGKDEHDAARTTPSTPPQAMALASVSASSIDVAARYAAWRENVDAAEAYSPPSSPDADDRMMG